MTLLWNKWKNYFSNNIIIGYYTYFRISAVCAVFVIVSYDKVLLITHLYFVWGSSRVADIGVRSLKWTFYVIYIDKSIFYLNGLIGTGDDSFDTNRVDVCWVENDNITILECLVMFVNDDKMIWSKSGRHRFPLY